MYRLLSLYLDAVMIESFEAFLTSRFTNTDSLATLPSFALGHLDRTDITRPETETPRVMCTLNGRIV